LNILLIPPKDWLHHPFKNRLNFIFERIAKNNNVYVLGYHFKKFEENTPITTNCQVIPCDFFHTNDLSLYYILNIPFHYLSIYKTVKKYNIDIIVTANILPAFLSNFVGKPIVTDYLDHFNESAAVYYTRHAFIYNIINKITKKIIAYNLTHSTTIITVTPELKIYLETIVKNKKIYTIPNGVDMSILYPLPKNKNKTPVLGYVGSIEYWVDLETPIRSMKYIDAKLIIIGPPLFSSYISDITKLIEQENVSDKVEFKGTIPYENLNKYINNFDIGLNPLKDMDKNNFSAGGKTFMYLACGIPVLSSMIKSLNTLLGNSIYYYNGINDFIKKITEILNKDHNPYNLRDSIKEFDWDVLAQSYENVLINTISKR
jgi:glycosyltransferase involved in cell wall biosynthesis